MKRSIFVLASVVCTIATCSLLNGQDIFEDIYADIARRNAMIEQSMAQTNRAIINDYRQRTGDKYSSDQQILDHSMQQFVRNNPGLVSSMNASHQARMHAIRQMGQRSQVMANAFDQMNAASMNGYWRRQAAQDAAHQRTINWIRDESFYANPVTGEVQLQEYGRPGELFESNGNTYYVDPNHRHWQMDQGLWQELIEFN